MNLIEISRPERNKIKVLSYKYTTSDYGLCIVCVYCGRFIGEVFKFNLLL